MDLLNFVTMQTVREDDPKVISFRSTASSNEQNLEDAFKSIVAKILVNRDAIIITKEDKVFDLFSDSVPETDKRIVENNLTQLSSFTVEYNKSIKHNCTLVKNIPASVAEDLATSSEFLYGNLWFCVSTGEEIDFQGVKEDITKLSPSGFPTLPLIKNEILAAPAMYDGLEILWFKPDKEIYENIISPLFVLDSNNRETEILSVSQ